MPRGYFLLDHYLLRDVLSLPDDADIVAVEYIGRFACAIWVEHSDIPEPKDNKPTKLEPIFKREGDQVTMVEWGIE